jgi:GntP family gluconate:H+ symporter/Gnt-I system low-affinity gluconate transporter
MIVGGPLYGSFIAKRIHIDTSKAEVAVTKEEGSEAEYNEKEAPRFAAVMMLILLPLVLMVGKTIAEFVLAEDNIVRYILTLIGHPFSALIILALLATYLFGTKKGYSRKDTELICTRALGPAGLLILITGAGAVFGEILVVSGIGDIIANIFAVSGLPLILFAWLTAAFVRVAQGSSTVAIITTATLMLPIIQNNPVSEPMLALLVVSIGAGSIFLSHLNDSAFWMFKRFFNLSEVETLLSWTSATGVTSIAGFVMCCIIYPFV